MRVPVVAAAFMVLCGSLPVYGQSTSVGVSFFGNFVRAGSIESAAGLDTGPSLDGESPGVAVRLTRALSERWGLDLEVGVPAEIETESTLQINLLDQLPIPPSIPGPIIFPPLPPIEYRTTARQQTITLGTTAWFRQPIGGRSSLAYYAGVSFNRHRQETETEVVGGIPRFTPSSSIITSPSLIITSPSLSNLKTVRYSFGPLVGMDARFGVTRRLSLVTGVRLHGIPTGWSVRPAAGIAVEF